MMHYLYPQNLKATANLWLWILKDFAIMSISALVISGEKEAICRDFAIAKLKTKSQSESYRYSGWLFLTVPFFQQVYSNLNRIALLLLLGVQETNQVFFSAVQTAVFLSVSVRPSKVNPSFVSNIYVILIIEIHNKSII